MASEWFIAKTPKKKYTNLDEEDEEQELENVVADPLKREEVQLQDENKKGNTNKHPPGLIQNSFKCALNLKRMKASGFKYI